MNDARTDELAETDEEITVEDDDNAYFPWSEDKEEWRRSFVFEHMANPEIDINILLRNMELAFKWLKDGTIPEKGESTPKKGLKSV